MNSNTELTVLKAFAQINVLEEITKNLRGEGGESGQACVAAVAPVTRWNYRKARTQRTEAFRGIS